MNTTKKGDIIGKILENHSRIYIANIQDGINVEFIGTVRDTAKILGLFNRMKNIVIEIKKNTQFRDTNCTLSLNIKYLEPDVQKTTERIFPED